MRRPRPTSLRSRLLWLTMVTLVAGFGVLVTVGNLLVSSAITQADHARLGIRLDGELAGLGVRGGELIIHPTLDDARLDQYAWVFINGRTLEHPSNAGRALEHAAAELARPRSAPTPVQIGTVLLGARELALTPRRRVTVVAGVNVSQLDALRRDILWGSVVVCLIALLGGGVAIRRVLGAALAPVERMTREAEDWEAHDLDRRFGLGPARDEITGLALTLDHLLERIAASRRHEQRFAAEVAHELRTPLAAIRGRAELARDESGSEADQALEAVVDHADRMAGTLTTLIAFARRERMGGDGVDLRAALEAFAALELIPPDGPLPLVEGESGLVRQIFAPLLDNARRHARSRVWVEVSVREDTVAATVCDDGPGVEPGLEEAIFEPGVRGAEAPEDGAGLGLPLARRLARSCGGEVSLEPGPGGRFSVCLPRARPTDRTGAARPLSSRR